MVTKPYSSVMENSQHTGSILAHESYETLEINTDWFFFFFPEIRDKTLKVYVLFLHILTAKIHVYLILSVHGDEGDDTVYFISFFICPHKNKYCVKWLQTLRSSPAVTCIGADLEPLCWSFNDRTMPINFSKRLGKCVA